MFKRIFLFAAVLFCVATTSAQTGSSGGAAPQNNSLSGVQWGAGLPRFAYPFGSKEFEQLNGGRSRQVGSYNFPISKNMAGVLMELDPGALRELHWHAEAAEWAYVISGQTRITLTGPGGQAEVADVNAGEIWYFPKGWGHSIQNIGHETTKFVLVLNNGEFTEQSTFNLSDWISHTPMNVLTEGLGIPLSIANQLPNSVRYMLPGSISSVGTLKKPAKNPKQLPHAFTLLSRTPVFTDGNGTLKLVTAKEFPASFNMSAAIIHLEPGSMRGLHWHPNADEWQMVLNGHMELMVFPSGGKGAVETLNQGDVGYVPKGYGHALKNLSNDKPLDVLVVFNSGEYQSIDLNKWLALTPSEVVKINLQIPEDRFSQFPRNTPLFEGAR